MDDNFRKTPKKKNEEDAEEEDAQEEGVAEELEKLTELFVLFLFFAAWGALSPLWYINWPPTGK